MSQIDNKPEMIGWRNGEESQERFQLPVPFVLLDDIMLGIMPWAQEHGLKVPNRWDMAVIETRVKDFYRSIFGSDFIFKRGSEMVADMKMLLAQIPGRQALYLDNTVSRAVAIESWNQLHLDINRAVDEKGRPIGLTERPGTPPLREQYQRLKVQLGGSKVVLIDDVIGPAASTIIEVMNDLEREGIYVEEIRAPYGFNTGVKVLIDQDVRVICPNMFGSSSDICCLRDTIPFLPTGGLKMRGLTLQGDAEEWRSVPYIYTYLHKPLWGKVFTIPDRFKQRHMLFSSLVAMTLFLSLEDLNHRKITYKDLGYVTDQTINLDDSSVVTEVEKWMFRVLTEDYEGVS